MIKSLKKIPNLKIIITHLLFLSLYIGVWISYINFIDFLTCEGFRIDYSNVWGIGFKIIYCGFGITVFLSFTLIKLLYKKSSKYIIYIVAFLLSMIFFASTVIIDHYIAQRVEFTKDMWTEHPETRVFLSESINRKYDLQAFSKHDIEELLGKPDEYNKDLFIYNDGNGNAVYFKFEEGVVVDMYTIR